MDVHPPKNGIFIGIDPYPHHEKNGIRPSNNHHGWLRNPALTLRPGLRHTVAPLGVAQTAHTVLLAWGLAKRQKQLR